MELVVLGPLVMQVKQVEKLKVLLGQYGLPAFNEASARSMVWDLAPDGIVDLGCIHLRVDITVTSSQTAVAAKSFMSEAMKVTVTFLVDIFAFSGKINFVNS